MAEDNAELIAAQRRAAELEQQLETERVEREYAQSQYQDLEGRLAPIRETVDELASNEELRALYDQAKKGREAFIRSQQDEMPAYLKPVIERLDGITGFVDDLKKREKATQEQQERANQAAVKAWSDSATSYLTKLNETVPGYLSGKKYENGDFELTDDGKMMVAAVSGYARDHKLSFEDAYKRVGDRFKPAGGAKTPPTSLQSDIAETGIPAEQTQRPAEGEQVDFADELERRLSLGRAT